MKHTLGWGLVFSSWAIAGGGAVAAEIAADRARFAQLDTSGNGYLSGSEITAEVRPYDANGDGRIPWEEFAAGASRAAAAADEALWGKLDWNPDGWLDGKELDGGWVRFDADRNGEVTKAEFLAGRAREREAGGGARATSPAATPVEGSARPPDRAPAPPPAPHSAPPRAAPASPTPAAPPVGAMIPPTTPPAVAPIAPRAGAIVGRLGAAPGVRLGAVTVEVSGFEDGKLASASGGGGLYETVKKSVVAKGSEYAVPVPAGAYRARAHCTYEFNGATYHFPLELVGDPKFDYRGLQLENLRGGLVRSFVLKLTGPKKGETEDARGYTETTYKHAFYGGRVDFYADSAGPGNARSLRATYPAESRLIVTLAPEALVDGSAGAPVVVDLALADDGKWTFNRRGVVPGTYRAEAKLRTPDGREVPLKLAAVTGNLPPKLDWQAPARFTFEPNSLGPVPRLGVNPVRLYLAE